MLILLLLDPGCVMKGHPMTKRDQAQEGKANVWRVAEQKDAKILVLEDVIESLPQTQSPPHAPTTPIQPSTNPRLLVWRLLECKHLEGRDFVYCMHSQCLEECLAYSR